MTDFLGSAREVNITKIWVTCWSFVSEFFRLKRKLDREFLFFSMGKKIMRLTYKKVKRVRRVKEGLKKKKERKTNNETMYNYMLNRVHRR